LATGLVEVKLGYSLLRDTSCYSSTGRRLCIER
jgi:hypothetical protein